MALINCPECNGQVSNTANTCPHCGYNIAKMIHNKKKRIRQTKAKRTFFKALLITSSAIIILLICILAVNMAKRKIDSFDIYDNKGHVRDLPWDSSISSVIYYLEKNDADFYHDDYYLSEKIHNFGRVKDLDATVTYNFTGIRNLYSSATVFLRANEQYTEGELYSMFQKKLTQKYGDPASKGSIYSGALSTWITDDSEIEIIRYNETTVIIKFAKK